MLKCSCGYDTDVIDSRVYNNVVRRRRVCKHCKERFTTREIGDAEYQELLRRDKAFADFLRMAGLEQKRG